MQAKAIQQLLSFSQEETDGQGEGLTKRQSQLYDRVSSWSSSDPNKDNFLFRVRKKQKQDARKGSLFMEKLKDRSLMNKTMKSSALCENINPAIYHLQSSHSSFYKRYNLMNSNISFYANKSKTQKTETVLSNVINLTRQLELIHDDRRGRFLRKARKRAKTLY